MISSFISFNLKLKRELFQTAPLYSILNFQLCVTQSYLRYIKYP